MYTLSISPLILPPLFAFMCSSTPCADKSLKCTYVQMDIFCSVVQFTFSAAPWSAPWGGGDPGSIARSHLAHRMAYALATAQKTSLSLFTWHTGLKCLLNDVFNHFLSDWWLKWTNPVRRRFAEAGLSVSEAGPPTLLFFYAAALFEILLWHAIKHCNWNLTSHHVQVCNKSPWGRDCYCHSPVSLAALACKESEVRAYKCQKMTVLPVSVQCGRIQHCLLSEMEHNIHG